MSNPSPTTIRPYRRRNGRRTYLYRFPYTISTPDILSEGPFYVTVRSANRISATRIAYTHALRAARVRVGSGVYLSEVVVGDGYRVNVSPQASKPLIRALGSRDPVKAQVARAAFAAFLVQKVMPWLFDESASR